LSIFYISVNAHEIPEYYNPTLSTVEVINQAEYFLMDEDIDLNKIRLKSIAFSFTYNNWILGYESLDGKVSFHFIKNDSNFYDYDISCMINKRCLCELIKSE